MVSHSWEYISHSSDTDTELDTRDILNTLPDRLKRIGELLESGESERAFLEEIESGIELWEKVISESRV
jgi:hypothetical protein